MKNEMTVTIDLYRIISLLENEIEEMKDQKDQPRDLTIWCAILQHFVDIQSGKTLVLNSEI